MIFYNIMAQRKRETTVYNKKGVWISVISVRISE